MSCKNAKKYPPPRERTAKVFSFSITTSEHKAINVLKYIITVKPSLATITNFYVSLFFLDRANGTRYKCETGLDKYYI